MSEKYTKMDLQAVLKRVESGITTIKDASFLSGYIYALEYQNKALQEQNELLQKCLDAYVRFTKHLHFDDCDDELIEYYSNCNE